MDLLEEGSRAELWPAMRCVGLCSAGQPRMGGEGATGLLPDPYFFPWRGVPTLDPAALP